MPGIRRDGSRISLEFTVVLIKGDDGQVEGVVAIMRDATEGWHRERELKRRVEELERKLEESGHEQA